MKRLLFFPLFLLLPFLTQGQQIKRLNIGGNYGFIIPHSSELVPVSNTSPYGATLGYQWMRTDEAAWNVCNCFHFLGIQASYHNFGNPSVLGSALNLAGSFEPLLWQKNRLRISLQTGIGISYLTQIHDPVNNPENLFFSTPISFLLFVTPRIGYQIDKEWEVNLEFAYNHISNGGQRQPNKGINYPMLGLGINKYFNLIDLPQYQAVSLDKKINYYFETGLNTRYSEEEARRKPSISLLAGLYKGVSSVNAFGAGIELTKDFSLEVENSRMEALMPAPFVAHHFLFGRFDFSQRFAWYANKPVNYHDHSFYQRYALQYLITQHLQVGFSLKTHGHVAENLDLRIGWKF